MSEKEGSGAIDELARVYNFYYRNPKIYEREVRQYNQKAVEYNQVLVELIKKSKMTINSDGEIVHDIENNPNFLALRKEYAETLDKLFPDLAKLREYYERE